MGRYLGKRLISTIPLLLVISFVVFMFIHMIPGDPARSAAVTSKNTAAFPLYVLW